MKFPLVTVAIPCFNHAPYISTCLNSIRDESYLNKEILIIDDGSKDDSVEKILQWSKDNSAIKLQLITRENRGLNYTLNELVLKANGEFIAFIASDDMLTENSIQLRLNVLQLNPNKLAVIGDAYVIDEFGVVTMQSAIRDLYKGDKKKYVSDQSLQYSVVKEWSIPGPVLMVRKNIFDIIGLYPTNQFAEDINFYLKVIGLNFLIFIDEAVAYYRIHSNNTGGNPKYSKEISITFIKAYLNNIKYFPLKLKLILIKKTIGRIYLLIRAVLRNN